MEILIQNGADANKKNNAGNTPLDLVPLNGKKHSA